MILLKRRGELVDTASFTFFKIFNIILTRLPLKSSNHLFVKAGRQAVLIYIYIGHIYSHEREHVFLLAFNWHSATLCGINYLHRKGQMSLKACWLRREVKSHDACVRCGPHCLQRIKVLWHLNYMKNGGIYLTPWTPRTRTCMWIQTYWTFLTYLFF